MGDPGISSTISGVRSGEAFTLDTSGKVWAPRRNDDQNVFEWPDLSPFEQGYVEALFASLATPPFTDHPHLQRNGVCFGETIVGFQDLAPETLAAIRRDGAAMVDPPHVFRNDPDAGAKCWRMRQEGWPLYSGGPSLRAAFPPLTVTLGYDGKVRFSPVDDAAERQRNPGKP